MSAFALRDYQSECIAAVHTHVCTKTTNPCVVLPTGSGKSVVMAAQISRWYDAVPTVRGCVLAHRKELVEQNHAKLESYFTDCPIGIFSAGLGRRDYDAQILFASIDSVYKKAGEFPAFDFLFVDECHRTPPSGDGKYRQFIAECQKINPKLRVVGWTATPFRMGCGPICHKDHILNEICYSVGVTKLIGDGFLSQLRTKVSPIKADLSSVKRNSGGDYVVKQLSAAACKGDLVAAAVARALELLASEKRKSAIFFCIDVEHCHKVSAELARHGIDAPAITGKTKTVERDRITANFKAKRLNAVCCVNVLTEGFDAPHIDAIILLRSTLSPGLFAQMVGRGLRIDPGKDCCLVLDFAGCIDEHGPIDLLGQHDKVVLAVCPECEEAFSRAARKCPECGWVIPKIKVVQLEREEAERRMHAASPSRRSILSNVPEVFAVDSIILSVHQKPGSPNSLKVRYRCGLRFFTEWICLEHMNYARAKASKWWIARFGLSGKLPTVADAVNDMFLPQRLTDWTKTITVQREGKYFRVTGYNAAIEKEEKDAT